MTPSDVPADDDAIDAVITWVDGDDPLHRAKLEAHLATLGRRPAAAAPTRFRAVGELDYCVASLLRFAPFLRRIHIVTDQQVPAVFERARHWPAEWANKLVRVDHRDIFGEHADCLPTFNSLSIETVLHRIPGLADRFVYLNDDFVLIKPIPASYWFGRGQPRIHGHWTRHPEQRLGRRLRAGLRRWLGLGPAAPRASYQDGQALASRLAGFDRRYLALDHHPHPMRRSTLEAHYAAYPQQLRRNVEPRLRDAAQFQPQALAAALEVRARPDCLRPDGHVINLKPARTARWRLRRQLRAAEADPRLYFACIQSLDEADADTQALVLRWLDQVVGRPE